MKPIFRNSMFGFHKEDVTKFIASQSKQQEKIISDLKKERDELTREYEEKIANLQFDNEELNRLRSRENKFESLMKELTQTEQESHEIIFRVNTQLDAGDLAVSNLKKFNSELIARLEQESEYREKAKRFDQLSSVLSGIVSGKPLDSSDFVTEDAHSDAIEPIPPVDFSSLRVDVEKMVSVYHKVLKLISEFFEK